MNEKAPKTFVEQEEAKANAPARNGWFGWTLKKPVDAWKTATLGSPLVGIAGVSGLLGYLGYKYGPQITKKFTRLVSPKFSGVREEDFDDLDEEAINEQKKLWGWSLGGLGALAGLALAFKPKAPGYGLLKYQSAQYDGLPLDKCMDMINENPSLDPTVKLQSLALLNSFNAPPSATVTGGDLVGQAIATGRSAALGAGIGYLTATVLGLPNPSSTAILGAVANTLGIGPALVGSAVFGK